MLACICPVLDCTVGAEVGPDVVLRPTLPEGNPGANLKSISHRCYLREVAFEWKLAEETIYLPLGCLQGGPLHP